MNDLASIKARLDAAAPGPWRALTGARQRSHDTAVKDGFLVAPANAVFPLVLANNEHVLGELSPWTGDAERDLIVHARADLERLYEEVQVARIYLQEVLRHIPEGYVDEADKARHYLASTKETP